MTNEQAAAVIREARATAKLMIDPNLPPEEAREISLAMVQLVEAAGGTPNLRPMTLEEAFELAADEIIVHRLSGRK